MFTPGVFFEAAGLFYIIILWSKPCFQKSPEHFLKRQRRRLFLQLRASFQVEKSLTFLKKRPTSSAFLTADQWQASGESFP